MKVFARRVLILLVLLLAAPVRAQTPTQQADDDIDKEKMLPMSPLGILWSQQTAGTGWLPRSTPAFGWISLGSWSLMATGIIFGGFDWQAGPRGGVLGFSTNWMSLQTRTTFLRGQFGIRGMFSLEPYTVGNHGYPLLLQTGNSFHGQPLVDRQVPQELTMEVGLFYQRAIIPNVASELYIAAAGAPALGPVSFAQRFSGWGDPFAPLGLQWMDSTHVSFGVITAGFYGRKWKAEASVFNGRNPDEKHTDINLGTLDSLSGRFTLAPSDWMVAQFSYGYLVGPNPLQPRTNVRRLTASAIVNYPVSGGNWASTFAWGRNNAIGQSTTNAFLVETTIETHRNVFFNRLEFVQKTGEDLNLNPPLNDDKFPIGSIVLGYIRDLGEWAHFVPGIGARVAVNVAGGALPEVYGYRTPAGMAIFVRVRPKVMQLVPQTDGVGLVE